MKSAETAAPYAARVLGALVLLQCVGAAWWWLRSGSQIGAGHSQIVPFVAGSIVFLGIVGFIRPRAQWLVPIAAIMLVEAFLATLRADAWIQRLPLLSQAVRYGGPVALLLLSTRRDAAAARVLRWSAGAVFLAHGTEALSMLPQFLDYIVVSIDRVFAVRLSEAVTRGALFAIGAVDVVVAALLVWRPTKPLLVWMAFWGFLTAAMRVIYYGFEAGTCLALVRVLNGGAPLVLFIIAVGTATRVRLSTPELERSVRI